VTRENNNIEENNIKNINTIKNNTIENISSKKKIIMDANHMEFIHTNAHL
jgi:hypothetical protein